MKSRRKIALGAGGAVSLLLAALLVLPPLLRAPLEARVRAAVNERVRAEVAWDGVSLSLLRGFPNASLTLSGLTIVGVEPFRGDTLAHVPRLRVVLDARSLFGGIRGTGPLVARSIDVTAPTLRLLALEDGSASWDILPPVPAGPETRSPMEITLRGVRIDGATITLDDRRNGLLLTASGIRHTLSADLGRARSTLRTRTRADALSLRFAALPLLNRSEFRVDADLDLDRESGRVTLSDGEIGLNSLQLALAGWVEPAGDSLSIDLAIDAPGTDIREILSLVPPIHARGVADLETGGTMAISGWIRGLYGTGAFPAFVTEVSVRDGSFQYPGLDLPASAITANLRLENAGGDADHTRVRIEDFRATIGGETITGALAIGTPVSDPDVDLRLRGRVNLADLARTVVIEEVEEMTGTVSADLEVRARVSDVEARRFERIHASGEIDVVGVTIRGEAVPYPVRVEAGTLAIAPASATIAGLRLQVGGSDAEADLRIDDPLGYALRGDLLRAQGRMASNRVDLNEWRSDDELEALPVPANVEIALDVAIGRVLFGDLDLRQARGSLHVADQRATLRDVGMEAFDGTVRMAGFYETTDPGRPTFDLNLVVQEIDVAAAAAGLTTVRAFAPVAGYAQGRVYSELKLAGALGSDLSPLQDALTGAGSLHTFGVSLRDLPALARLADALGIPELRDPTLVDFNAAFSILDGRLFVRPFDVGLGPVSATVSGSNGVDATLDYALAMQVPTGSLGQAVNASLTRLASRLAPGAGAPDLGTTVTIGARITGTMFDPAVALDLEGAAGSITRGVRNALEGEVERRNDEAEQRLRDASDTARLEAEAEAARRVVEAQRRAAALREEARTRAEETRLTARERADALVARAENPVARRAAGEAASRLLREADDAAERLVADAEARGAILVEEARDPAP